MIFDHWPVSASLRLFLLFSNLAHFGDEIREIGLAGLPNLLQNALVSNIVKGSHVWPVFLMHIDRVCEHELLSVVQGRVSAPIELKEPAVSV